MAIRYSVPMIDSAIRETAATPCQPSRPPSSGKAIRMAISISSRWMASSVASQPPKKEKSETTVHGNGLMAFSVVTTLAIATAKNTHSMDSVLPGLGGAGGVGRLLQLGQRLFDVRCHVPHVGHALPAHHQPDVDLVHVADDGDVE